MTTHEARQLFDYNSWATARMFSAAKALTPEQPGRTDADLEDVMSYRGGDGQAFAHPLEDLIRHVVNHSTYHRGQLVTLLRQLGHTPPSTDFTRYPREGASHDAKLS